MQGATAARRAVVELARCLAGRLDQVLQRIDTQFAIDCNEIGHPRYGRQQRKVVFKRIPKEKPDAKSELN